jgi:ABC-type sugar transport system ATPase subunit
MRNGIAFVPEDRKSQGLVLMHSISDNLSLATLPSLSAIGIIGERREKMLVLRYMERLKVRAPDREQTTGFLSGGNQQKVVLAKWLAIKPKVLIVDEPTRGVDVGTKAEIYTLFRELATEGLAILLISSDLPEVINVTERVIVMRHGTLAGELLSDQITEEGIMRLAALGRS